MLGILLFTTLDNLLEAGRKGYDEACWGGSTKGNGVEGTN